MEVAVVVVVIVAVAEAVATVGGGGRKLAEAHRRCLFPHSLSSCTHTESQGSSWISVALKRVQGIRLKTENDLKAYA